MEGKLLIRFPGVETVNPMICKGPVSAESNALSSPWRCQDIAKADISTVSKEFAVLHTIIRADRLVLSALIIW